MNMISTVFTRPWTVRSASVFRYLDEQYADAFFTDGSLRIPTFQRFRNNPDEEIGDPYEGRVAASISAPNANWQVMAMNGQRAYVLSTSTIESRELHGRFVTNFGIRIQNSIAFANAISSHLPGFLGGMEGLCSYHDKPHATVHTSRGLDFERLLNETKESEVDVGEKIDRYVAEHVRDLLFIKRAQYAHQSEYRFIWYCNGYETNEQYIDIKCPEARRFCEKVDLK
ncbi:hypothetical protein [Marilutibacter chinensis]|uniref:Uncharacterized protein n=1 Tax=Marilutibacter chinensis TaxID=2912247 RepID=A0ABS9HWL1_9GAMM|nr:hypothetical protein [Lysobacter chinensis]MCF7223289.1 hypothetical protein [Lysobacter chinensis]